MATNIEMNYYNGNTYITLRPMGDFSNMGGNLTSSQIPNLDMSKITTGNLSGSRVSGNVSGADYATNSGKVGGYTYSQIISNASSSGSGCKVSSGSYTGTGAMSFSIITSGISNGQLAFVYFSSSDFVGNNNYRSASCMIGNSFGVASYCYFSPSYTSSFNGLTSSKYSGNKITFSNSEGEVFNYRTTYCWTAFGT